MCNPIHNGLWAYPVIRFINFLHFEQNFLNKFPLPIEKAVFLV